MAFLLSPGVNVTETDLTSVVPAVATSIGGFVGTFQWGPVNQVTSIDYQGNLVARFGRPNDDTATSFYCASNFLDYTNQLRLVRVTGANARNATSYGTGLVINNYDDYEMTYMDGNANVGPFAAKYPGVLGNSIQVVMADASTYDTWEYKENFTNPPNIGDTDNDEVHVLVLDKLGKFTGTKGAILEKYAFLSKAFDSKSRDGTSNYYKNVLSNSSAYVYWMDHPDGMYDFNVIFDAATNFASLRAHGKVDGDTVTFASITSTTGIVAGTPYFVINSTPNSFQLALTAGGAVIDLVNAGSGLISTVAGDNWGAPKDGSVFKNLVTAVDITLAGGVDHNDVTDEAIVISGWSLFSDAEAVDVNLLIAGPVYASVSKYIIESIAETRKDCIAFVSPPRETCVNNPNVLNDVIAWRKATTFNVNSSYGAMDSGWKYQYDQFNDTHRWVPLCADMAGLHARTDSTNDAWFAAGGLNRGQIKNVVKLAWNPGQMARDQLYQAGINPVTSFPGQGIVLFGNKTLLAKPSAFDRINVRRLFIVLEKAISRAARFMLFEFNDPFTRAQLKSMIEPYLRMVQGRRGITGFKVACDEQNNTDYIISTNQLVADIYIKPNLVAEFITLNFVAVNNVAFFTEQG